MKEKKKKEKRKRKKEKKKVMWYKFRTKINKKIVQIPTKIIFVCAKNSCNNLIILRAFTIHDALNKTPKKFSGLEPGGDGQ